jgi:hypothetical protein
MSDNTDAIMTSNKLKMNCYNFFVYSTIVWRQSWLIPVQWNNEKKAFLWHFRSKNWNERNSIYRTRVSQAVMDTNRYAAGWPNLPAMWTCCLLTTSFVWTQSFKLSVLSKELFLLTFFLTLLIEISRLRNKNTEN